MFAKQIFPGLNTYFNRYDGTPRYFVQGKGEIRLGKSDFKAQGGEGAVYVKGSERLQDLHRSFAVDTTGKN